MVFKSRWTIDIPQCSLPTFIFKSPREPVSKIFRLFIDAARPETHYLTTYDFRLYSQRLAAGLKRAGFQDGERILVFSPNTLFYPVAFMGTVMAGGIFNGCNPTYTVRELAYQLKDSGARYILCVEEALDTAIEAAQSIGKDKEDIFVFDSEVARDGTKISSSKGCRYWTDLLVSEREGASYTWKDLAKAGESSTTIALNYSSGTTGLPKGVDLSHRNYITSAIQTALWTSPKDSREHSRFLGLLPMYHAIGQAVFISSAKAERQVYIMAKFDPEMFLAYVEKFRITSCVIVPAIAVALAKATLGKKYDLSSMTKIVSGAAPLGMPITKEMERLFGKGVHIRQGWGMTESTCAHTAWSNDDEEGASTSVGELLQNAELKIMAEDGVTELGVNQPGELWIAGPNIMKGYWCKPEATKESFSEDGKWYKTGDIGYCTDHGKFYIIDRIKELIKVKGFQVAPAELEALLLLHPAIADAGVIGVTRQVLTEHERLEYEELPRAYVVLKAGATVTEKEIVDFISERVHKTKRLTGGVKFIDAIPKNASGKILRRVLREKAKRDDSPVAKL
ncbi:hypothetical protein KEM54_006639 [Ascosphaera aggregata]|nr:hypothetical protein KEM54_006639 [Ascosphaera aggregata]